MNRQVVKFNSASRPEFIQELRSRVSTYFKNKGISHYGNWQMWLKTAFMITLYFGPLTLMLTGVVSGLWPVLAMWVLMGFGMAGIGFSIMHDANHGSYSRNKKVNKIMGFLIHFIGGFGINWKIQHNVLHHSYTNIDGFDEDIGLKIMRFSPTQPRKPYHRFQLIYAPFLYSLMTLYWSTSKDFEQLVRYRQKGLLQGRISFGKALAQAIAYKLMYFALVLVLPLILVALPWWQIVLGFVVMHLISGLLLALVFQPAHVTEETDFFKAEPGQSMANNWAIHQMYTTANFAHKNRLLSWFIGGLNYQIEHHLFPNICHVHYRQISRIVREVAAEFEIPYLQFNSFVGALRSHFVLLHELGTGKYERKLALTAR